MTDETPNIPVVLTDEQRRARELADLDDFGPRYSLKDIRQMRAIRRFLQTGKVNDACKAAGVKYGAWYRWMEEPDFRLALEKAKQVRSGELEEIAEDRAREGSDALLMFLLKANDRAKYGDRQTITVVSPEVQSRLQQQADVILNTVREMVEDDLLARKLTSALANRLRDVWGDRVA